MTGFTVESEALHATGRRLQAVVEDLDSQVTLLRTRMEGLLGGAWTGAAARDFGAGWRQWERGFTSSRSGLEEMARLLGATAEVYGRAEADIVTPLRAALEYVR